MSNDTTGNTTKSGQYNRRSLIKSLGAGSVVAMAGCIGDGGSSDGDGPIKMGGILPLTGSLADPAQWVRRAWNLRVEQVNDNGGLLDRQIDLTIYDSELDTQQMQTQTSKLLTQDNVDVFLGPYPTLTMPTISPLLARENMTALHQFWPYSQVQRYRDGEGQWPNQYGFSAGTLDYPRIFIDYLDSLKGDVRPERIAMIGRNDTYGEDAAAAFEKFVGQVDDIEIVADQRFEVGSTDLSPIVRSIEGSDPDVIVCNSYANSSQLFAQAVADVGLHPDFLWANVGPQVPSWIDALDGVGEYVFASTPYAYSVDTESNQALIDTADEEYGSLPHYSFGFGTIQFDIYQQAIESVGEIDQQGIADAFDSMTFSSVTGDLAFENNYIGSNGPMFVTQAQDRELPIVYPEDARTSEPVAPLPEEWPNQEWP